MTPTWLGDVWGLSRSSSSRISSLAVASVVSSTVGAAPSEGRRDGFLEDQRPSFGDQTRFLASMEKSPGIFQIEPLSVEGRGRSVDAIDAGRESGDSFSPVRAPALLANGLSLRAENGLDVGPMLVLLGSAPECLFIHEKLILRLLPGIS